MGGQGDLPSGGELEAVLVGPAWPSKTWQHESIRGFAAKPQLGPPVVEKLLPFHHSPDLISPPEERVSLDVRLEDLAM